MTSDSISSGVKSDSVKRERFVGCASDEHEDSVDCDVDDTELELKHDPEVQSVLVSVGPGVDCDDVGES